MVNSRRFCALLLAALSMPALGAAQSAPAASPDAPGKIDLPDDRDPARPMKAAIFRAKGFPTVDAPAIPDAVLDEALGGLPMVAFATPAELAEKLRLRNVDVLVLPYGSAFPVSAWQPIRWFVERGGGLVVLGGAPFHAPVRWAAADAKDPSKGSWSVGPHQPTFAHELLIGPVDEIPTKESWTLRREEAAWSAEPPSQMRRVFALTIRLTTKKDFEKEDGTSGPRDGVVRPLLHLLDPETQVPAAAPILEIDRLRGSEAGGRWVLAPQDGVLSATTIRACVKRALEGAAELDARPAYAAVNGSGKVDLRVTYRRPRPQPGESPVGRAFVRPIPADGSKREPIAVELHGPPEVRVGNVELSTGDGVSRWEVSVDSARQPRSLVVGVAGEIPKSSPKITVSRDWLRKDGVVFPIVGTTYMASDVHRKFLFEPNPAVWDRDFMEMKRLGVNFVRTGLWTGWQRAMLDPGAVDESVLRALDAYVACAAKHGIVVCFNFFAFQPPMFGGTNPFLDPRALEGQKALLTAVARRYRDCGWVHWDLINEPSYCPPEHLWSNRPIGDESERRAWAKWVIERHGDDPLVVRERWRDASAEPMAMPRPAELTHSAVRDQRRPRKAGDFVRFSNDAVARWAADLRSTLRAASGELLVTLGQDEGGTWVRPAQQLYASAVDYTSVHTWWNNEDLLWDGVVTKVPEKPSVIQETGLMRLEDLDGRPWRDPEAAARLLERKLAYSWMARGGGSIQWAWNINPYQPIDNEAVIGIFRPDGTAKPELRAMSEFGRFFEQAAPLLDDFEPDSVILLLPHSRLFAGRPNGFDGTKHIVRMLAERFGVVPMAISELAVTAERLRAAKLVIVPTAELLEDSAAQALLAASRAGTKVLFTGVIEGDPYGRSSDALSALGVVNSGRAVALREPCRWGSVSLQNRPAVEGAGGWVTFDARKPEWLRRSDVLEPVVGEDGRLPGVLWHHPLPLEFALELEPLRALLEAALRTAGVETHPSDEPIAARVLLAPKSALVICVNETPKDAVRTVKVDGRSLAIPVAAGRSTLTLIERASGRIVVSTRVPG